MSLENARASRSEMDQQSRASKQQRLNWKSSAEELETFRTVVVNYNFAPRGSTDPVISQKEHPKTKDVWLNSIAALKRKRRNVKSKLAPVASDQWSDVPNLAHLFALTEQNQTNSNTSEITIESSQVEDAPKPHKCCEVLPMMGAAEISAVRSDDSDKDDRKSLAFVENLQEMKPFTNCLSNSSPNLFITTSNFASSSSSTQSTQTKVKSMLSSYKQRQHELNRYRIAVEQKRLELLELKVAREREEVYRDRILFQNKLQGLVPQSMVQLTGEVEL